MINAPFTPDIFLCDSFRIRIPIQKVTIESSAFNAIVSKVVESTGEVLSSEKNKMMRVVNDGITSRYTIEREISDGRTGTYSTFIILVVNAKMLRGKYFEGITIDNVRTVYEYLMDQKVVSFSFEDLISGQCTDIDYRKDFYANEVLMMETLKVMEGNAKPNKDIDSGALLFDKKNNKGLQFNKRTTKEYLKAPYLKIYSKYWDLESKSNEFKQAHGIEASNDMWRIEYTIKNKKHLTHFGIGNTLQEVLSVPQTTLKTALDKTLRTLLHGRIKVSREVNMDSIPPKDTVLLNALIYAMDTGKSWIMVKNQFLGSLEGSNRSKWGKALETLYSDYLRPISRYSAYEENDKILTAIGYTF